MKKEIKIDKFTLNVSDKKTLKKISYDEEARKFFDIVWSDFPADFYTALWTIMQKNPPPE